MDGLLERARKREKERSKEVEKKYFSNPISFLYSLFSSNSIRIENRKSQIRD
jgi:hypothetical protein